MIDEDTINQICFEDRKQRREENDLKNRILNMTNGERKEKLWHTFFTPLTAPDDSYIHYGTIF